MDTPADTLADLPVDVPALLAAHPVIDGHNDLLWEAREQRGDVDREVGGGVHDARP